MPEEKEQPRKPGDETGEAPREEEVSRAGTPAPPPPEEESPKAADSPGPESASPGAGASPEEEAALFEGNPGHEELHQALDAALPEEDPSGSGEEKADDSPPPSETAREASEEEDEEDYEFDLEGISLDDPSEQEEEKEEEKKEKEEEKAGEGPAPTPGDGPGGQAPSPPGEDPWPEDEKEGTPLLALLKERLARVPRRKAAFWAVLLVAPLVAVLLLGIPTKKIEKVLPTRIPEPRSPRRVPLPRGEIPRAVPGYLPPVEAVRPLPPRSKDRPPLWAAAEQKARGGDYAGAIILLEKFLAGNPPLTPEEKSGAWYDLSRWYRKVGDKEASRKYFSMALDTTWSSLGPKDLLLGGLELHKAGKYSQARRYFAAFLLQEDLMVPELKKKIAQAWYLLAEGYRLEAEAGEKAQERREEALQDAAGGAGEGKR